MKAPMTFSSSSIEREKDRFTGQSFYSGSQSQVIALNSLSKNFASWMLILRRLSGITPPAIADYHADV